MFEGNFEIKRSRIDPEKPPEDEKIVENRLAEAIDEMCAELREVGESLREIVPQDRNFDIELRESEVGVNLRIKHKKSEAEKDLSVFLPQEHYFGKDKVFIYRGGEKKIGFPEKEIEFRGFLLSLFHEIGHSHEKQGHSTTRWDDIRALGGLLKKWVSYVTLAVKKEREQKGSGKKIVEIIKKLDVDDLLPQWYLDKKTKSDAQSERGAWAYALHSLRRLEREGYDVFAGFENVAQIRGYVAYCLYTYDIDLFVEKMRSGNIRDLQQLNQSPTFWKGSKMSNRVITPDEIAEEPEKDKS